MSDHADPLSTVIAHSRVTRVDAPGSKHRLCPRCDSTDICIKECSTTCLGGGDGTEDGDPNHRVQICQCRKCQLDFERHAKYADVWYIDPKTRVLLRGVATCFEEFYYPCTCGGVIYRRYTKLDGITKAISLGWSSDKGKDYRVFWKCDACEFDIETTKDHA